MLYSPSEKILIEEITEATKALRKTIRNVPIGSLIKTIRKQVGMSQNALAQRAGVPQSTVSRIEKGTRDVSVSTLQKVLEALSCDLLLVPVLKEPIASIRKKQAHKVARKQISYLKGTMNLEQQQPDTLFMHELLNQEEERLLHGSNIHLWNDHE